MLSSRLRLVILGALLCISVLVLLIIFGRRSKSCNLYNGSQLYPCPAELNNAPITYLESLDGSDIANSSPCAAIHYYVRIPTSETSGTMMKGTCPWEPATKVLGYIGVGLAFLYFIVFTLQEIKPELFKPLKKFVWIGGALATLTLGVSYILMIVDIVHGQGFREDYFVPLQEQMTPNNLHITSNCVAFIMNFIVTVASLVILGTLTCWSFKINRQAIMASEISEVLYAKR